MISLRCMVFIIVAERLIVVVCNLRGSPGTIAKLVRLTRLILSGVKLNWIWMDDNGIWYWLVVWNMNFIPFTWDFHHPNWRTHIFQRGRNTTNQDIMGDGDLNTSNLWALYYGYTWNWQQHYSPPKNGGFSTENDQPVYPLCTLDLGGKGIDTYAWSTIIWWVYVWTWLPSGYLT